MNDPTHTPNLALDIANLARRLDVLERYQDTGPSVAARFASNGQLFTAGAIGVSTDAIVGTGTYTIALDEPAIDLERPIVVTPYSSAARQAVAYFLSVSSVRVTTASEVGAPESSGFSLLIF